MWDLIKMTCYITCVKRLLAIGNHFRALNLHVIENIPSDCKQIAGKRSTRNRQSEIERDSNIPRLLLVRKPITHQNFSRENF